MMNNNSSKKKLIAGIVIAAAVTAIIVFGIVASSKKNEKSGTPDTDTYSDVSAVTAKSIRFKDTSLTLKVGESFDLEITVEPDDGENNILKLKTDDPSIASVDSKGTVTAAAPGVTTLTATLKSDSSVTASLEITVIEDTDSDSSSDKTVSDTDTSEDKKNTDTSSDSDAKKKDASSASAKKNSDSDKKTGSSSAASSKNTSSGTRTTAPVYSWTTNGSNNGTSNNTAPSSNTTNSTENTSNGNNGSSQTTSSENNNNNNGHGGYIDPNSVGKSTPISYVATNEKKVAISFDASWGNDKTQKILDTLDRYGLKSTFFLVGIWVRAYPDDVKKISEAGHDIGNHSNTHPDLTQLDSGSIRYEMETCSNDIEALTGKRPTLFRNPYGAYDDRVIGTALGMGMDVIQWDIDTLDWTNNSGAEICARIRNGIRNGSIILMHNAGGSTADSLPMIIDTIQGLGYEIVPISELVPQYGYTTDISGKAIPMDPPAVVIPEPEEPAQPDTEDTESDIAQNTDSENDPSSTDTDIIDSDTDAPPQEG